MIFIRNSDEITKIKKACQVVKASLDKVELAVRPGVTTWELNQIAEQTTLELGAKPAFKGYKGFPACLCTSVNNEVVHGIPRKDRVLKEGDVIGIDYGASWDGYYGDSARTVAVGFKPEGRLADLLLVTKQALVAGIAAARAGAYVQDIGRAIEGVVRPKKFGIVEDYVGHGIGTSPHEDPPIPHYITRDKGPRLREGMVICIEPMINMGSPDVRVLPDGWTVVTEDGQWSAHFEHTLLVTNDGGEVLTG